MKRFWKEVTVAKEEGGWSIKLDSRAVKTPARAPLVVPVKALTDAIADEWRAIGEEVDPRAMPLTGLANAAIDRVAPGKAEFAAQLSRYAEADLACYRVEGPSKLVARQEEGWGPLLGWAQRRYDVDFATTSRLLHVAQPPATVERLSHAIAELDAFQLAGLSPLVTIGGSLVAALAVLELAIAPEVGWDAISLDEHWQLEQWGADSEAEAVIENRRRDFLAAARFLELLVS